MSSRNKPNTNSAQQDAVLIDKFLDNQKQELIIEEERVRVRNKELDNDKFLASKSIEAQLKDRSEQRTQITQLFKHGFVFSGVILFMLLIFGGYVIANDKEALLSEIIGLFIEFLKYVVGAAIGYLYAKANKEPPKDNKSE